MKAIWLGLCLLPLLGNAKNYPTAECDWLFKRIKLLEQAIKQGDELRTREELATRKGEFSAKRCNQYDY